MLRYKILLLAFLLFVTTIFASCGQTGDLYLPEEKSDEKSEEGTKEKPKS